MMNARGPVRAAVVWRLVVLVAALAANERRAGADAIPSVRPLRYDVSGTVGHEGITGREAIQFVGVAGGTLYDDASRTGQFNHAAAGPQAMFLFDLGTFVVDTLPPGERSRYDGTPYALTLQVEGGAPVELKGTIRATVDGDAMDLTATLDRAGSFAIPNIWDRTSPHQGSALAVETGGFTSLLLRGDVLVSTPPQPVRRTDPIRATAAMFPVPEPASWLVLLSLSAGLVFRRRLQARMA